MPPPPPAVLLAYRFVGWRVGPDHRDWVLRDITSPGWLVRQGAPALSVLLIIGAVATALVGGDTSRLLALIAVLAGAGAFLRTSLRDRALRQQGLDPAGGVLPLALPWYADEAARRRRNLVSAIGTTVTTVGALFVLAYRSRG